MKRIHSLVLTAALFGMCGLASSIEDAGSAASTTVIDGKSVKLARYSKVYVGKNNEKVVIATYKIDDFHEGALLQFSGIEGPWDGLAINHVVKDGGYGDFIYVTQHQNSDWNTMRFNVYGRSRENPKVTLTYPGGPRQGLTLMPSNKQEQALSPQAILQTYSAGLKSTK